ncbi:MAG: DUF1080 domain-containing protein [Fibrobacteria bacterium]
MLFNKMARIATSGIFASLLISTAVAQDNQLTPKEVEYGYDLLFNGVDLKGWHGYKLPDDRAPDAWYVATNTPLGPRLQNRSSNKNHLLSNKKYKNFDLKLEAQTPAAGNSGVFVRYEEVVASTEQSRSGPEMQVCGPSHNDCVSPEHSFGAAYEIKQVTESIRTTWYKPPGQWNQMRIIAFDSNYVHYGNGVKLLEYKIGTPEFIAAYNDSKYARDGNNGRYYHIHEGSVLLQDHSTTGQTFRNIKAKSLDVHPFKREFADGKWPDALPQDFVFGKALTDALSPLGRALPPFTMITQGPGVLMVRVPMEHSGFEASGIDGRAVPFQKVAYSDYRLERGPRSTGIVIVRAKVAGRTWSQIVTLP